MTKGTTGGVLANMLDFNIIVGEFELNSRCFIDF